jgi:hypothetical protein
MDARRLCTRAARFIAWTQCAYVHVRRGPLISLLSYLDRWPNSGFTDDKEKSQTCSSDRPTFPFICAVMHDITVPPSSSRVDGQLAAKLVRHYVCVNPDTAHGRH